MSSYELYRRSTLGLTLADALDDMIQNEQITPQLALRVVSQFDRSMITCLESKIRSRGTFKGHLHTYRFCDDVWTFVIEDALLKVEEQTINTDRIKIVACNSNRNSLPQ
ncbi:unnamed protein product [Sphagnum compactum]